MKTNWRHETTVEVQTSPEDLEEINVCLHVSGIPKTSDYFCRSFGNWLPGDPAEIELLRVDIEENGKWRKAIPACYPDSFDQAVFDAVDEWWDEHSHDCWESLEEGE